jgi:hypothetical protein
VRLEALRVDVDDGRQPGTSHRRGRCAEEPAGLGGDASGLRRFRNELRAELPA